MIKMMIAVDSNFGIGYDNKLLFRIKEDLNRFRNLTFGGTMFMGRKTFESLPNPLPLRKHVVLTRNKPEGSVPSYVTYTDSIDEFVDYYRDSDNEVLWVIGGAEVCKLFLPHTDEVHLTHIHKEADKVDTYFPYQEFINEGFKPYGKKDIYSDAEDCKVTFARYKKPSVTEERTQE